MQLRSVMPNNTVDGFDVTIVEQPETLAKNPEVETLLIDYYYELCVICTGTNSKYGDEGYAIFLISQLTDLCRVEIIPPDEQTVVVILKVTELLESITITEGEYNGEQSALLCIEISDTIQRKHYTLTWILRQAQHGFKH